MSGNQVEILMEYRRQLMDKIHSEVRETVKKKVEEILPERKVTPLLKVSNLTSVVI